MAYDPSYYQGMSIGARPPNQDEWESWTQEQRDAAGMSTWDDYNRFAQAWRQRSAQRNEEQAVQNEEIARELMSSGIGANNERAFINLLNRYGIKDLKEEGRPRFQDFLNKYRTGGLGTGANSLLEALSPGIGAGIDQLMNRTTQVGHIAWEGFDPVTNMFYNWRNDGTVDFATREGVGINRGSPVYDRVMNSFRQRGITDARAAAFNESLQRNPDVVAYWGAEKKKERMQSVGDPSAYRGVAEDNTPSPYAPETPPAEGANAGTQNPTAANNMAPSAGLSSVLGPTSAGVQNNVNAPTVQTMVPQSAIAPQPMTTQIGQGAWGSNTSTPTAAPRSGEPLSSIGNPYGFAEKSFNPDDPRAQRRAARRQYRSLYGNDAVGVVPNV